MSDKLRGMVTLSPFEGDRVTLNCGHDHTTPEAAAHCGQLILRRMMPNSKDRPSAARYATTTTWIGVRDGDTWANWAVRSGLIRL